MMKFTYLWLKNYLRTDKSPQEIADTLTRIGLEIESIEPIVAPIVAEVKSCEAVPGTHLHLLQVNDGSGKLRQVVCGAPNVRAGVLSILARPGCVVGGHEIKCGKIRGHESNGMMCAWSELGVPGIPPWGLPDGDGIAELDPKQKVNRIGDNIVYNDDWIFEGSVLPNRPDYLGVIGIARDLAAAGAGEFDDKTLGLRRNNLETDSGIEVKKYDRERGDYIEKRDKDPRSVVMARVDNPTACPVYCLLRIDGVNISARTGDMPKMLQRIGINPKNHPVDATNYVCYGLGQPMHCFDADEVKGLIVVRNAKKGEKFTDLFGTEHELITDDLVISDDNGVLALAGVVGGARGMVSNDTKNIIFESAYFEPIGVRKTARRLKISTDSSYRFERGTDPEMCETGLAMAYVWTVVATGGDITGLQIIKSEIKPTVVKYDPKMFKKIIGTDIPAAKQKKILESLGFVCSPPQAGGTGAAGGVGVVNITVPSWRIHTVDVPQCLVSEIARMSDVLNNSKISEKITKSAPKSSAHKKIDAELGIKKLLAGRGITECVTFGFGNLDNEKILGFGGNKNIIKNPLNPEMNVLRNNNLENLLLAVAENQRRGMESISLFEMKNGNIAIVRAGIKTRGDFQSAEKVFDFFDIKSDVMAVCQSDSLTHLLTNPLAPKWANPHQFGKTDGGEFGMLHPLVARHFGLRGDVFVAIIENIAARPRTPTNEFSPFQEIKRDFAFVTDSDMPSSKIINAVRSADGRIIDVLVFDIDTAHQSKGKKSIAFTVTIQPDSAISETEIMEIQNKIIKSVEKTGAELRSK